MRESADALGVKPQAPEGMKTSRRRWLGLGLGLGAMGAASPGLHLGRAWVEDGGGFPPTPEGHADDASHLERTRTQLTVIEGDTERAAVEVQAALFRARTEGLPASIAGARHTMGGHTIAPGGLQLDLSGVRSIALEGDVLRVGAGARWEDVLPFLDARGRAVRVMQSNADFSIGGSLGANCHGWQPGCGPLASTVRAFSCVVPDGRMLRCSRDVNADLFRHVIGGYGTIAVVLEVELETAENVLVESRTRIVTLDALADTLLTSTDAELAFARLSIPEGDERFEEVIVTDYRRAEGEVPPLAPMPDDDLARLVFRGEIGSPFGKSLRWLLERELGGEGGARTSRNQLMSEPVARFGNRNPARTDVLFEGFVPPQRAPAYAREVREIVAEHEVDLLNVTVRHVRTDPDAVLTYAPTEVLGLVMLFSIPRTRSADEALGRATRELIDAAHAHGGRYYLPYRSHATRAQFERAYPEAESFRAFKRAIDPDVLLQNRFFETYLRA